VTRVGRLAAVIAVALTVLTIATWNESMKLTVDENPVLDGATLFKVKGCATCHYGPDSSFGIYGVPPLTEASAWAGDRRPGMSAVDYLTESMRTPSAFISPAFRSGFGPLTGMPDLNLSEAEIAALVAYLLR
jgi:mono/diheme cytochrome c family protein